DKRKPDDDPSRQQRRPERDMPWVRIWIGQRKRPERVGEIAYVRNQRVADAITEGNRSHRSDCSLGPNGDAAGNRAEQEKGNLLDQERQVTRDESGSQTRKS